jgi:hypothetical protein
MVGCVCVGGGVVDGKSHIQKGKGVFAFIVVVVVVCVFCMVGVYIAGRHNEQCVCFALVACTCMLFCSLQWYWRWRPVWRRHCGHCHRGAGCVRDRRRVGHGRPAACSSRAPPSLPPLQWRCCRLGRYVATSGVPRTNPHPQYHLTFGNPPACIWQRLLRGLAVPRCCLE